MKVFHSIRFGLFITFTLIVLVSVSFIGAMSYGSTKAIIVESVYMELSNVADKLGGQINSLNTTEFKMLHGLAELPFLRDDNISLKEKNDISLNVASMDRERYADVTVFNDKGGTFMGDFYIEYPDAPHVASALNGVDYVVPPFPNEENFFLCYGVPIYNYDNKVSGLIGAIVQGFYLTDLVTELSEGGKYTPVIVDRSSGIIIAHPDRDVVLGATNISDSAFGSDSETVNRIMSGERDLYEFIDTNGVRMVCSYAPVGDTCSWSVLCAAPYDSYYAGMKTFGFIILLVSIGTLVVANVLAFIIVSKIVKPLTSLKSAFADLASGNADLSKRINVNSQSEVGDAVESFNVFTDKLHGIMVDMKGAKENLLLAGEGLDSSTKDTSGSITEILDVIENVDRDMRDQSQSVVSTANSVNAIAKSIESLEQIIESHSTGVEKANASVEQMVGNINSVNQNIEKMSNSFAELSRYAQEGSRIQFDVNEKIEQIRNQSETLQEANSVIASIAEQTNLLAMNAAIEAAHAGEAGKGFSVVADEIRKLSETSSSESKTIGEQLNSISASIEGVVEASGKSSSAFSVVTSMISQTDELVSLIRSSMEEQDAGSRRISDALHEMNDSTMEVRAAGSEMSRGNKQILEEVKHLEDTSNSMSSSMGKVTRSAEKIKENGSVLFDIADKLKSSIENMGSQIDNFQV